MVDPFSLTYTPSGTINAVMLSTGQPSINFLQLPLLELCLSLNQTVHSKII